MQSKKGFLITIAETAWDKMHYWCKKASPREVGGVARVRREACTLYVDFPQLLPQTVSQGSVDFQAGPVHRWLEAQFGKENVNCAMPKLDWCFWHTHPTFSVGWSSTDETWISNFANAGLLVSLCLNVKGDLASRVDSTLVFADFREGFQITPPSMSIILESVDEDYCKALNAEYDENVTIEPEHALTTYLYGNRIVDTPLMYQGNDIRHSSTKKQQEREFANTKNGEIARLKVLRKLIQSNPNKVDIHFSKLGPIEFVIGKTNIQVHPTTVARSLVTEATGIAMGELITLIQSGMTIEVRGDTIEIAKA